MICSNEGLGACRPTYGLVTLLVLLGAVIAAGAAHAARVQIEMNGYTDNTNVGSGDPCGNGKTGGQACNGYEIVVTLVVDTGFAPADQDAATNHSYHRDTSPPGFVAGNATINGHTFTIPSAFSFNFDQIVEVTDDLDASSLGYDKADNAKFTASGGQVTSGSATESFSVSTSLLMQSTAYTGDALTSLESITGSPLIIPPGFFSLSTGSFNFENATGQVQGQFRVNTVAFGTAPPLLVPAVRLISIPDVDGDGAVDIGVVRGPDPVLQLLSGKTGTPIGTRIYFGGSAQWTPLGVGALPDLDKNGVAEVVMVGANEADGRLIAEVRNATGIPARRAIPIGVTTVDGGVRVAVGDVNNDGVPDIAVLGQRPDGLPWAQIKDTATGALIRNLYFASGFEYVGLEIVQDLNANGRPELAALGIDAAGRVRADIRDLQTGIRAVPFNDFGRGGWIPTHATGLDVDLDGFPDVLSVLGIKSTGDVRAQSNDAGSGVPVGNVGFGSTWESRAFEAVPDSDGSGSPELAVFQQQGLQTRIYVRDAASGIVVAKIVLPAGVLGQDLAVLPDLDGNGKPEIASLGETEADGGQVQVNDVGTGQQLYLAPLP